MIAALPGTVRPRFRVHSMLDSQPESIGGSRQNLRKTRKPLPLPVLALHRIQFVVPSVKVSLSACGQDASQPAHGALDEETLADELGDFLSPRQQRAVLKRRDLLLRDAAATTQ